MIGTVYGLIDPRFWPLVRYVGQTIKPIEERVSEHIKEAKRDKSFTHKNNWIRKLLSLNLVPISITLQNNIDVPFICWLQKDNRFFPFFYCDELNEAEINWIKKCREICEIEEHCLTNETEGGEGLKGLKHSPETLSKMRGRKPWNAGLTKEIDSRLRSVGQKTSIRLKGKKHTEETKEKMKNSANNPEAKIQASIRSSGVNNGMYGKHHSDDTKEKIRASKLGKHFPKMSAAAKECQNRPEVREAKSRARKGKPSPMKGIHFQTKESKEKNRQAHIGKKASPETKALLSKIKKGSGNSFYGKHHSDESKKKIGEKSKKSAALRREINPLYILMKQFYEENKFLTISAIHIVSSKSKSVIATAIFHIINELQLSKFRIHLGKPGQPEVGYGEDEQAAIAWYKKCQQ